MRRTSCFRPPWVSSRMNAISPRGIVGSRSSHVGEESVVSLVSTPEAMLRREGSRAVGGGGGGRRPRGRGGGGAGVDGVGRAAAVRAEVDVERVRARGDRQALRGGAVAGGGGVGVGRPRAA